MKQGLLPVLVLALLLPALAARAADPRIETNWTYYEIEGSSALELVRQMKSKGPRGYWAYAKWRIRWTAGCRVTVRLYYTFPRWTNPGSGSARLRSDWRRMTAALKMHEENHGKHGIAAGREILAAGCKGGNKIIRKWAREDKRYDLRTRHGRKEGVKL